MPKTCFQKILEKKYGRKFILLALASSLTLNSGCIHTSSRETKSLELPQNQGHSEQVFGNLKIASTVYLPTKLPLKDFFTRMKNGEFTQAFKKIDLNYKQSNINDEVLADILEAGFIPVYVQIENTGSEAVSLNEKNFILDNGPSQIKAYYAEALPKEFKKFNPKALAANVVNTGIVVIGFTALIVAMLVAESRSSGALSFPKYSGPDLDDNQKQVFNSTTKTTQVDYKDYLITSSELKPGEIKKGLLFFNLKSTLELDDYQLRFL